MSSTFQNSAKYLWTSESVTEGHPDKVCDQLSDAILDWCLTQTPQARVACEASVKSDNDNDYVWIYGEVTPLPPVEVVQNLVRRTLSDIGYTDRALGTSAETAIIDVKLIGQSADIALGVNQSLEAKAGEMTDTMDTGAGDQGMMVGFACDETPEYMPMAIALAHRLTRRLTEVRKAGMVNWLRPDGKSQVTVEYAAGAPKRVHTVVVSTQHDDDVEQEAIRKAVIEKIVRPVVPGRLFDERTIVHVNPTGQFVIGGPHGDSGLTGRKIIVDTYGGYGRHGGGAFSGKDPTKVDRSACYMARYIAKNLVASGLADKVEVQLAYAIGVAEPVSVLVDSFGSGLVDDGQLEALVRGHFPLTPRAIIEHLDLRRPIYRATAAYGHFGREEPGFTWEHTDKAQELRAASKVGGSVPALAR